MRVLLCVLFLGVMSGCWSHDRARPRAGFIESRAPLQAEVWPARDTEALIPLLEQTPREVCTAKVREGVDPTTLSESERRMLVPESEVVYKGIHARNLLRIYRKERKSKWEGTGFDFGYLFMGFQPNGYITSSRTIEKDRERTALNASLQAAERPRPTKARKPASPGKIVGVNLSHLYLEAGLPVHIPDASPEKVKGLLIHLQSLGANDYEPKVLEEFRQRGWAVIDIKPQSFILSPIPQEWHAEIKALNAEYRDLAHEIYEYESNDPEKVNAAIKAARSHPKYARFTEVEARIGKLRRGGFQVCNDEDRSKVAAQIAREIDQGMAGAAYAVEAILDYVDTQRPDLQRVPTVLMGFSAGALATPTAAARMEALKPGRISGVVLIAGGCNLLRIARESAFNDGGLRVLCGEEPVSKEVQAQLFDLYLGASKLDPYHTAPLIAHLPVLQVHASKDTWVPAPTGELLYQRLNCPERLLLSGNHDILFYLITQKQKWIADWVEREVQPAHAQSAKTAWGYAAP